MAELVEGPDGIEVATYIHNHYQGVMPKDIEFEVLNDIVFLVQEENERSAFEEDGLHTQERLMGLSIEMGLDIKFRDSLEYSEEWRQVIWFFEMLSSSYSNSSKDPEKRQIADMFAADVLVGYRNRIYEQGVLQAYPLKGIDL